MKRKHQNHSPIPRNLNPILIKIVCKWRNTDIKYVDEQPKNAVKWISLSIKDIEKDYGDLWVPMGC